MKINIVTRLDVVAATKSAARTFQFRLIPSTVGCKVFKLILIRDTEEVCTPRKAIFVKEEKAYND
jgi:hypothetical protein